VPQAEKRGHNTKYLEKSQILWFMPRFTI